MWGCYRSLPAANTVDGTVKVSYGVGWGGMLAFIASGKHCRPYGEGVGWGGRARE